MNTNNPNNPCCYPDSHHQAEPSRENEVDVRDAVRNRYSQVATSGTSCCGAGSSCCSPEATSISSASLGYDPEDLASIPEGADLGLGCGNPHAIANLRPGETVLDLGSGPGLDCLLAARAVGSEGKVIGVDMTPEMVSRARATAAKAQAANVEFRLGEIEHLPVADSSVDVIISNCVINLSPDKPQVFREAYRVLKPGGRLAISDIVALTPLPDEWKQDLSLLSGCISGASTVEELTNFLAAAGFENIEINVNEKSREFIKDWQPGAGLDNYIASAEIKAIKPANPETGRGCCCS
ncbi:MAG: arsenite methyltransferase [Thermoleophilia bacterium]|nr:arsenite methyltransferase [Thermoleophilia bacterium]